MQTRSRKLRQIEIDGSMYELEAIEIPFREGVELRCVVDGELIQVSDRQLGEREALRILEEKIRERISAAQK